MVLIKFHIDLPWMQIFKQLAGFSIILKELAGNWFYQDLMRYLKNMAVYMRLELNIL
jgi:hypothetical protein